MRRPELETVVCEDCPLSSLAGEKGGQVLTVPDYLRP